MKSFWWFLVQILQEYLSSYSPYRSSVYLKKKKDNNASEGKLFEKYKSTCSHFFEKIEIWHGVEIC